VDGALDQGRQGGNAGGVKLVKAQAHRHHQTIFAVRRTGGCCIGLGWIVSVMATFWSAIVIVCNFFPFTDHRSRGTVGGGVAW
jgi:hypothetical protein